MNHLTVKPVLTPTEDKKNASIGWAKKNSDKPFLMANQSYTNDELCNYFNLSICETKTPKIGDCVRYGNVGGSIGLITSENHYGGFYVTYFYGKDIKGEDITAKSSHVGENIRLFQKISGELWRKYKNCRAWSVEQKLVYDEILDYINGK